MRQVGLGSCLLFRKETIMGPSRSEVEVQTCRLEYVQTCLGSNTDVTSF